MQAGDPMGRLLVQHTVILNLFPQLQRQIEAAHRVQALRHILPIDQAPESLQPIAAHIEILQVVRVLPRIDDQQRHRGAANVSLVIVNLLDDEKLRSGSHPSAPQPEPCTSIAASVSWPFMPAKEPKDSLMTPTSSLSGSPPPCLLMLRHNSECSTWPER